MDTVLCFSLDKCSVREYTCIPHVMFVMLPLCRGLCVAECQSRDLGILHFLGYPILSSHSLTLTGAGVKYL